MSLKKNNRLLTGVVLTICLSTIVIFKFFSYAFSQTEEGVEPVIYTGKDFESPFKSRLPKKIVIENDKPQGKENYGAISLPSLNVQGIVWAKDFPQAIIDGTVVKAGDKISGAQILEIEKNRVKLLYEGNIFFVSTQTENKEDK